MKKIFNLIASILSIFLSLLMGYCSFILYISLSVIDSNDGLYAIEKIQQIIFLLDIFLCIALLIISILSIIIFKKDKKWIKLTLLILSSLIFISMFIVMLLNKENINATIVFFTILLLVSRYTGNNIIIK